VVITENNMMLRITDFAPIPSKTMIEALNKLPEILNEMNELKFPPAVFVRKIVTDKEFLEYLEALIDIEILKLAL
jgi:hypothetical protein